MCNATAYRKYWKFHPGHQFRGCGSHSRARSWKEGMRTSFHNPPANVREFDDRYELYLFAPGYEKSDFLIALIDDTLSISVETSGEENNDWKRKEYNLRGFVREFELNEKIDKSAIVARYENGVLIVRLPKSEGFETQRQEIEVA